MNVLAARCGMGKPPRRCLSHLMVAPDSHSTRVLVRCRCGRGAVDGSSSFTSASTARTGESWRSPKGRQVLRVQQARPQLWVSLSELARLRAVHAVSHRHRARASWCRHPHRHRASRINAAGSCAASRHGGCEVARPVRHFSVAPPAATFHRRRQHTHIWHCRGISRRGAATHIKSGSPRQRRSSERRLAKRDRGTSAALQECLERVAFVGT